MVRATEDHHRLIIAIIIGMIIGELLPEPTDPIYFYVNDWLMNNRGTIPDFNWYALQVFCYYCLSAIWYIFLLGFFLLTDITPRHRMFWFIGLISLGGVVGVIIMSVQNTLTFAQVIFSVVAIALVSVSLIYVFSKYAPESFESTGWWRYL